METDNRFKNLTPEQRIELFLEYGKEGTSDKSVRGYISGLKNDYARSVVSLVKENCDFFELDNLDDVKKVNGLFKDKQSQYQSGTQEYTQFKNYASYSAKYIYAIERYLESSDILSVPLTLAEYGSILQKMYANAPTGKQVASIYLFGIKYGDQIVDVYKPLELIRAAGLSETYATELNKAYNLFKLLREENYELPVSGSSFVNNSSAAQRDIILQNLFDEPLDDPQERVIEDNNSILYFINSAEQVIYYGAPGTGKSNTIKLMEDNKKNPLTCIRTTFHPDSDYATFVGCYKPHKIKSGPKQGEITYEFVEQAFLDAYKSAWMNPRQKFALVIEEINRGNCAQIFGDIFQLLDRDEDGWSTYPIKADADIADRLEELQIEGYSATMVKRYGEGKAGYKYLALPPNLSILATMNTSDQSLFPIDSAFKRRWDWKYMPINTSKENWLIMVNGQSYSWTSFLDRINGEIEDTTSSEDKKLGFYFCKAKDGVISAERFVSKVLFYLYNDVFKDYGLERDFLKDADNGNRPMSFHSFYSASDGSINEAQVEKLLVNLGVEEGETNPLPEDDDNEQDSTSTTGSKHRYIKSVTLDGKTFSTETMTHFEVYYEVLKRIGIDQVMPIVETCKYKRLGHPLVTRERFSDIEQSNDFSYVQLGNYYVVKGVSDDTLINILNLLKDNLSLDLSIEIDS